MHWKNFSTVKNNVKSENLREYIKELELAIFGHDDDEELEYDESIAERTKMRRQNKETDKKDASRTFAPPDPDSDDSDKFTKKCIIHLLLHLLMMKRLKKKQNRQKKYMRKAMMMLGMMMLGMMVLGITSGGLIKMGLMKMGMTSWGLIKMGLIKMVMMNMGSIKMGSIKMEKK